MKGNQHELFWKLCDHTVEWQIQYMDDILRLISPNRELKRIRKRFPTVNNVQVFLNFCATDFQSHWNEINQLCHNNISEIFISRSYRVFGLLFQIKIVLRHSWINEEIIGIWLWEINKVKVMYFVTCCIYRKVKLIDFT